MRIYKYKIMRIVSPGMQQVELPYRGIIRKIGVQQGSLVCWMEVNEELDKKTIVKFHVRATGDSPPKSSKYVDTVFDEVFVWHVYMQGAL